MSQNPPLNAAILLRPPIVGKAPMYRVSCIDGDRWRILDAGNRLVFVGTRQQGEDWLDFQENARPRPSAFKAQLRGLVEAWVRPLGRLVTGTPVRV